jgi:triphosphoribosyl-dephospho-CoA synthetase
MNALTALQPQLSLGDWLADLAVDALIDEADLSPKPGLVDRRGSGAHTDLHLGLMHASALALWPSFKAMAEAAQHRGAIGLQLREDVGRIGREGEAEMLRVTGGVNTHRGAIWALVMIASSASRRAFCSPAPAARLRVWPCSTTALRPSLAIVMAPRFAACTACMGRARRRSSVSLR